MKKYSFLVEAETIQQNMVYQQANDNQLMPVNPTNVSNISFDSIFKPVNIMQFTLKSRGKMMKEANIKLGKINKLSAELQRKSSLNNPQSAKYKLQYKYAQIVYKTHHEFINKAIFWKSRAIVNLGPQFAQLKEQYSRQLFVIQQNYKREALGLDAVDTGEY